MFCFFCCFAVLPFCRFAVLPFCRFAVLPWSPAKETAEENDDLHLKSGRGDFGERQENDKLLEIDVEKSQ